MVKPIDVDIVRTQLTESLTLLASSPDLQIGYLERLKKEQHPEAELVDELGLEYGNLIGANKWRYKEVGIGHEEELLLSGIDNVMAKMSNDDYFWSYEGLRSAPEWEQIRRYARNCLEQITPGIITE